MLIFCDFIQVYVFTTNHNLNAPKIFQAKQTTQFTSAKLHGPSVLAVKAKIYVVLYKQSRSVAFD